MTTPEAAYRETLRASWSWWLLGGGFVVAVWWAFFVSTPAWATWLATGVAAVIVGAGLATYGGKLIVVDGETLRVGAAHLPRQFVGDVEAVEGEGVRRLIGVDADATAYVVYRAYISGAIKVQVVDPRDHTPYWVISTRHPEELAERLRAAPVQD